MKEIIIASKSLQPESVYLMTAYDLLGALLKVRELHWSFEEVVGEAPIKCSKWRITHRPVSQKGGKIFRQTV